MMNKFIAMCRLTRDPEVRYGGQNNTCIARYGIAVDRRYKREGEPDADFFDCVSFGKQGEFVEKYLRRGTKVLIEGELQNNNYTNKDGQKVYGTRIVVNSIEFAESKREGNGNDSAPSQAPIDGGFMNIPDGVDEELPF